VPPPPPARANPPAPRDPPGAFPSICKATAESEQVATPARSAPAPPPWAGFEGCQVRSQCLLCCRGISTASGRSSASPGAQPAQPSRSVRALPSGSKSRNADRRQPDHGRSPAPASGLRRAVQGQIRGVLRGGKSSSSQSITPSTGIPRFPLQPAAAFIEQGAPAAEPVDQDARSRAASTAASRARVTDYLRKHATPSMSATSSSAAPRKLARRRLLRSRCWQVHSNRLPAPLRNQRPRDGSPEAGPGPLADPPCHGSEPVAVVCSPGDPHRD